jgi:hypothetical protein
MVMVVSVVLIVLIYRLLFTIPSCTIQRDDFHFTCN